MAYRKDPNWYLCEWLRQDCAGRGGCCGRSCNCCEKLRASAFGVLHLKWDHGHCISACGCYIRTRGYTEDQIDKKRDSEDFPSIFRFTKQPTIIGSSGHIFLDCLFWMR